MPIIAKVFVTHNNVSLSVSTRLSAFGLIYSQLVGGLDYRNRYGLWVIRDLRAFGILIMGDRVHGSDSLEE